MCWSRDASLAAAGCGLAGSVFLYTRNNSARDAWYAAFVAAIALTQVFDAFFWSIKEEETLACSPVSLSGTLALDAGTWNKLLSRFILPPVFFSQLIVLSLYPSSAFNSFRRVYRALVCMATLFPMVMASCTTILPPRTQPPMRFGGAIFPLPALVWGGLLPSLPLLALGVCAGALGCILFVRPHTVWIAILALGGFNLCLLQLLDGNVFLVSKLCFWCGLLSLLFAAEPLWLPPHRECQGEEWPLRGLGTLVCVAVAAPLLFSFAASSPSPSSDPISLG